MIQITTGTEYDVEQVTVPNSAFPVTNDVILPEQFSSGAYIIGAAYDPTIPGWRFVLIAATT